MDNYERLQAYALKVKEAEKKALGASDSEIRQAWEVLARSWRLLARHVRNRIVSGE